MTLSDGKMVSTLDPSKELAAQRYLSLATFRASSVEVRTPVWVVAVDNRLYVFTGEASGKVKRLRRSSRARVAPCDARGHVRGAWRDGAARVITDAAVIARARRAFKRKYGWQLALFDLFARLAGRTRHRTWIEITLCAMFAMSWRRGTPPLGPPEKKPPTGAHDSAALQG